MTLNSITIARDNWMTSRDTELTMETYLSRPNVRPYFYRYIRGGERHLFTYEEVEALIADGLLGPEGIHWHRSGDRIAVSEAAEYAVCCLLADFHESLGRLGQRLSATSNGAAHAVLPDWVR